MADIYTHAIKLNWTGPGTESLTGSFSVTGDGNLGLIIPVAASTTNLETDITFAFAKLKSVYLLSTQTVTLKANSTSAPTDTIVLTAGVPRIFQFGSGQVNMFTADVTKIYITNATLIDTVVNIRILTDSTP